MKAANARKLKKKKPLRFPWFYLASEGGSGAGMTVGQHFTPWLIHL